MTEASPAVPPASAGVAASLRPQVESFLGSMLKLMDYPATLDFKDMPDGALGVALHLDPELPGLTPGKRSYLIDCMQFLVNKVINRPNVPRRWVNLAVNQFPEPRPQQNQGQGGGGQRPEPTRAPEAAPTAPMDAGPLALVPAPPPKHAPRNAPKGPAAPQAPAPAAAPAQKGDRPGRAPKSAPVASPPASAPAANAARPRPQDRSASRGSPGDERGLTVTADPVWTALGQSLAEKAVKHGRVYALMMISPENRARLLEATRGTKGLTVKTEGEGYFRRVAFVPEKIAAITKKPVMPDYDDEDE